MDTHSSGILYGDRNEHSAMDESYKHNIEIKKPDSCIHIMKESIIYNPCIQSPQSKLTYVVIRQDYT